MCHLHDRLREVRRDSLLALHAQLPQRLHRSVVDEELNMSIMHGTHQHRLHGLKTSNLWHYKTAVIF